MPELPEVEVVKRSLERKILDSVIKKVKIKDGNLRYKVNKREILKLYRKKIKKIKRRSKFLIFEMSENFFMLVHLGMTGKFFFIDKNDKKYKTSFYYELKLDKEQKHDRVIFLLNNKKKLIFNDVRKFGFIKFYKSYGIKNNSHFKKLGPEPLNRFFNFTYLKKYIQKRNRSIKDLLMDQKCVSGLGNIYVNEILFFCRIKPTRKVNSLRDSELEKIVEKTKKILKTSIKLGGSTIKNFLSDDGNQGVFQQYFKVYGRKGEICSNTDCKNTITRIIISGRATFFCKNCQK